MDLEKFFDTVSHSKLTEILSWTVKDGRVISLIHKYLNAGVMKGSIKEATPLGVPQGSPLSPLLGNIMLNEPDRELERRGHRFVRYADDLVIFWIKRPYFKENPQEAINILSKYKTDESEYVRKSVGNALKDISKTYPELITNEISYRI
jgi:retron-type reverse transcriptase